ncbi:UPF0272 protein [Marinithermofilum abyssi]|uniref:Pyridinium-3,5-bisthiocarboxylic acid mononucleotide nickel insertion protein n=1 Tax=Marinithermofilum abyssi TaxID=1571185 RepID=A0A8J2VHS8_9BACL|nr:nickel pincer cofactor biosynthesis protein LarC [Marinithermofilum abyssi]GGE24479.1 UPF0272 protein [Marinithermofilum abyssi]
MNTLYLDCAYGISGDMTLAALIDLGADLNYITDHLRRLPINSFEITTETVVKQGITAQKLKLDLPDSHPSHRDGCHSRHRHTADLLQMIRESELPNRVKQRSLAVFEAIASAEGKIHGIPVENVHFHEVGAMDSIIDIIGVCLAMEHLRVGKVYASPVPTGHGKIRIAHGLYPVPAPATAELLKGIPLAKLDVEGELTTPTGAGFLHALVQEFAPFGGFTIDRIGYGAGEKDFDHPNILRAILVHEAPSSPSRETETIWVLETQVDDMTGEALGHCLDRLFKAGALDVYYTPVYMKKNRPGTLLTVLTTSTAMEACENILFWETSTLGIRRSQWLRRILERKTEKVETPLGSIRIKVAYRNGMVLKAAPEYEDVARLAHLQKLPFREVYEQILTAFISSNEKKQVL